MRNSLNQQLPQHFALASLTLVLLAPVAPLAAGEGDDKASSVGPSASLAAAAQPNSGEAIPADAPLWIDVRSADEFASGHLPGALLIPHEQIVTGATLLDIPKDRAIALYCRSGRRAGLARDALLAAGYRNVINAGGLEDALQQTGQVAAVEKPADTEPPAQAE